MARRNRGDSAAAEQVREAMAVCGCSRYSVGEGLRRPSRSRSSSCPWGDRNLPGFRLASAQSAHRGITGAIPPNPDPPAHCNLHDAAARNTASSPRLTHGEAAAAPRCALAGLSPAPRPAAQQGPASAGPPQPLPWPAPPAAAPPRRPVSPPGFCGVPRVPGNPPGRTPRDGGPVPRPHRARVLVCDEVTRRGPAFRSPSASQTPRGLLFAFEPPVASPEPGAPWLQRCLLKET